MNVSRVINSPPVH